MKEGPMEYNFFEKLKKKFLTPQGPQSVAHGGPISQLVGGVSKNASMMLFVFL